MPILGDTGLLRSLVLREPLGEGLMWMEGRGEKEQDARGMLGWAAVLWFWVVPMELGSARACCCEKRSASSGCCMGAELPLAELG